MGCPHEPEVRLLLEGLLDAEQTRRMMDHVRSCDDCRQRLEFRGATEGATTDVAAPPTYRRYSFDDVSFSHSRRGRNWVRGLFAMAAVVGLTFIAMRSDEPGPKPADPDREAVVTARAGLGLVRWPVGSVARRPRAFEVILPEGALEVFTLRVSRDGAVVYEELVRPDAPGVHFDAIVVSDEGREERLAVRRVMAPFPAASDLPMEAHAELAVRVFLGDRPGPVTRFTLTPETAAGDHR